jgi:DNA processing protein
MQITEVTGNQLPARLGPVEVERLYVRGTIPSRTPVAIVGSRRPTPYGRQIASRLATRLGECGVPIVSGLAFGIDTIAHQAGLEAGGSSLAILPCGVDDPTISPQANLRLAGRITERGALASEYPSGVTARKEHYSRRNRIVAGLADVVVVIEAGIPSGTLITARHAAELSKDLWAVPGPITSEVSQGTNRLINEGAKPLIDLDAFYQEIGLKPQQSVDHPLLGHIGNQEVAVERLVELSGRTPGEVEQELIRLELKGVLRRARPGVVARV